MTKSYIHSFCSFSLLTTEDSPLKHGLVTLLYCFYFNFKICLSYFIWARFSVLHFFGDRFFFLQGAQTGSGARTTSSARVLGVFNPAVKKLGYEVGHFYLVLLLILWGAVPLFPPVSQHGVQG
jgi:hypothetical protein